MPFKAIVQDLVNATPGASGAIVADWEGEAVVHYNHCDDYEMKVIGAHGGIMMNLVKEVHQQFVDGGLQETVISTGNMVIIIGSIGPDYSLIMTLARNSIVGRALYRFRQAVKLLEKEIY